MANAIIANVFNEFLDTIEFNLIYTTNKEGNKVFKLKDRQEANLGHIESNEFYNLVSLIDRLDIYIQDYYINDLIECLKLDQDIRWSDYDKIISLAKEKDIENKHSFTIKILEMIVDAPNIKEFYDTDWILNNVSLDLIA